MLNAIIIDDVPQAIATLAEDLRQYCPEIQLIGTAQSVVSGVKLLREKTPDVLFLDIQLQDGTGFDLLECLPDLPFKIIFTTASDAFAIRAFRFSAVDYLLKPIDPDELITAVKKLSRGFPEQDHRLELLRENMRQKAGPRRMALHTQEKIHVIDLDDIIRCEASGNYTTFFFLDQKKLLVTRTLKEYEKLLDEGQFIRVHQTHLVNIDQIKEFVKVDGGYLIMRDGTKVPVSVRRKPGVIKRLETL